MVEQLLSGTSWSESVVVGLQFQRDYELYLDANVASGSCGAVSLGDAVSLASFPLLLCGAKREDGVGTRCVVRVLRVTAPAIVSFVIPRQFIIEAAAAGYSSIAITLAMADLSGNEVELIQSGTLYLIGGGL